MKRLLYVATSPSAGTEEIAAALARNFAADKIVLSEAAEACETRASFVECPFLTLYSLRCRRSAGGRVRLNPAATETLRRQLLENHYDVIFLDGGDLGRIADLASSILLDAKIVIRRKRTLRARLADRRCLILKSHLSSDEVLEEIENHRKARMRLALVTNRFWPEVGGAETNIYHQARHLARHFEVTVFCPRRDAAAPAVEECEGFTIRRLYDLRNPFQQYPNTAANTLCPGLFWRLWFGRFHMIQCFPALNHNNMLAVLAGWISGAGTVLASFDFIDYSALMKPGGKPGSSLLAQYRPGPLRRLFLRLFDQVFAISHHERDYLCRYNANVAYSPVPIELEEYRTDLPSPRAAAGFSEQDFVILMLGRVCHTKGQDIGLHAFEKCCAAMPGSRLAIVGRTDYEPDYGQSLLDSVRVSGLEGRVLFTGMVDREQALAWLRHADIHLIPVRFMNSGAVVMESWISGTPVIQSDVVDPNFVRDGENGYLFPTENEDALAETLLRAYRDRVNLPVLARSGENLVRERFTYECLMNLYRDSYRRILTERQSPVTNIATKESPSLASQPS